MGNVDLSGVPEKPGVYRFYSSDGTIIYVGKAKNLKRRVSSYFINENRQTLKSRLLVRMIASVDYVLVNDEREAFLLENALIKENKPKYNILLKDDKSYPWVCVTHEEYPRIVVTRRVNLSQGRYYGPYTNVGVVKFILKNLRNAIPFRSCKLALTEERVKQGCYSSCLEFHIKRCKAPCISNQSKEEYLETVHRIEEVIKGSVGELLQRLGEELRELEEGLQFEKAEELNRQIEALRQYTVKNAVVNPRIGNWDVITLVERGGTWMANYMQLSEGTIRLSLNKEVLNPLGEDARRILDYLSYYFSKEYHAANRMLLTNIEDFAPNEQYKWVECPKIGDKKKLILLSLKNANNELNKKDNLREIKGERPLLEEIKSNLGLKRLPHRIECIDNSNTLGTYPVSACVVFINGKPAKSEYRIYHIKTVEGPNDYKTMEEVLERRYGKMDIKDLPDLLILDGGKGQLSTGIRTLQRVKRYGYFDMVGLAEVNEEIFKPGSSKPLLLDKNSNTLRTIIQLRDEAHRFGVKHHTKRRDKDIGKSLLEEIPGIGQKTVRAIYGEYSSLDDVTLQGKEKLEALLGGVKATLVWEAIQSMQDRKE